MLKSLFLSIILILSLAGTSALPIRPVAAASPTSEPFSNNLALEASLSGSPLMNVSAVAAGDSHTCVLTSTGGIRCWGDNQQNQLGIAGFTQSNTPVNVAGLDSGTKAIAAGSNHTCAIYSDDTVWCWGPNWAGQLGSGSTDPRTTAERVPGLSNVAAITAGSNHTCALTTTGDVWCWGSNSKGQLGQEPSLDPLIINFFTSPVQVTGLSAGTISALAAGLEHTCALTNDGKVYCWGDNSNGQLGNDIYDLRISPTPVLNLDGIILTAITAGFGHTCALMETGGVKCWGSNWAGQLGDGTFNHSLVPVDVVQLDTTVVAINAGSYTTCARTAAGGVQCWGYNDYGQLGDGTLNWSNTPVDVLGLISGTTAIDAGGSHSCALSSLGSVKCWGLNRYGQLGDGTLMNSSIALEVNALPIENGDIETGSSHACTLTDGEVFCWGDNSYGQLGDGTTLDSSIPVLVSNLTNVAAITAGSNHTCAITATGDIWCWGSNSKGQLGQDPQDYTFASPVKVTGLITGSISHLTAGLEHTCALTIDGKVFCWGNNSNGELGDGTVISRFNPGMVLWVSPVVVTAIEAGSNHTCALTETGEIWCWGSNVLGQLGVMITDSISSNPLVIENLDIAAGITAGDFHTCAVTTSNQAKCWGNNLMGQIGDGTTEIRSTPVDVSGLSSGVSSISAGGYHTCALLSAGGIQCWGDNLYGQLGDGTITQSSIPRDVSGFAYGAAAVSAGGSHTCALTTAGGVKCWGRNLDGQLGTGRRIYSPEPVAALAFLTPSLAINHPTGAPGSFFTFTGQNFPSNSTVRLSVDGYLLAPSLAVNETGGFIFFINTGEADVGRYTLAASGDSRTTVNFELVDSEAQYSQEGGGTTFTIPPGLGGDSVYLPILTR